MDMKMQRVIGLTLRYGVIASVLLILFGLALMYANNGGGGYSLRQIYSATSVVNTSLFTPQRIVTALWGLDGLGFVLLGLMVLIATPMLRVVISVLAFAREGNRLYTVITLIVLLDLMLALFVIPALIAR